MFFRIQPADRDVNKLLDPESQYSRGWNNLPGEDDRDGISVCRTEEALTNYLGLIGADPHDAVIVTLDGTMSDDEDHDADMGAVLVHPTEIISVEPIPADMLAEIDAMHEELMGL